MGQSTWRPPHSTGRLARMTQGPSLGLAENYGDLKFWPSMGVGCTGRDWNSKQTRCSVVAFVLHYIFRAQFIAWIHISRSVTPGPLVLFGPAARVCCIYKGLAWPAALASNEHPRSTTTQLQHPGTFPIAQLSHTRPDGYPRGLPPIIAHQPDYHE